MFWRRCGKVGRRRGTKFYHPKCVYSKCSDFCGEFKYGCNTRTNFRPPDPTSKSPLGCWPLHLSPRCTSLPQVLDLGYNRIRNLSHVRPLSLQSALRSLRLEGNPVALAPGYSVHMHHLLPWLWELDGAATPANRLRSTHAAAARDADLSMVVRPGGVETSPVTAVKAKGRYASPSRARKMAQLLRERQEKENARGRVGAAAGGPVEVPLLPPPPGMY